MSPADGAIALEPRDMVGGNNPPPSPFDAVRVHLDDTLLEANNYADGAPCETQGQVDEASRIIDELRKGARVADDLRVTEKKVHDDAIAEIQSRFNIYIGDPKTKSPGKVWRAIDALKAYAKPYLDAQEALRLAAAERARLAAVEAQRVASEAARAAQASDLAAQDAAEELILAARRAEATARQIEQAKPQARGGERAMGLKKTFTAALSDPRLAILHYMNTNPSAFTDLVLSLAQADVNNGRRTIPGVTVIEGTKL